MISERKYFQWFEALIFIELTFVQSQLDSGKYENQMDLIMAAISLLQKQEDIYQGRLLELQQDALSGWEASQSGKVVDGPAAMSQIRANLHNRYGTSEA